MEGIASMIIILASGQSWVDILAEQSDLVKFLALFACIVAYITSGLVIFNLYYSKLISTVASASLVAIILTLIGVLTAVTVRIEYGIITDTALLFLYITYNIWTIAQASHANPFINDPKTLYSFISKTMWTVMPAESLATVVSGILDMLSVEIIFSLFLQMSVFILASRVLCSDDERDQLAFASTTRGWSEWFYNVLWPCFGKCAIVLVYTYAWLIYGRQANLAFYFDPIVWRWINIFMCLSMYTRHLTTPPEESNTFLHED